VLGLLDNSPVHWLATQLGEELRGTPPNGQAAPQFAAGRPHLVWSAASPGNWILDIGAGARQGGIVVREGKLKHWKQAAVAVVVGGAVAVSAVATSAAAPASGKAARDAAATKPIAVGVISAASGPYAAIGEAYMKGVQLAADVWSKAHPKQPVKVFYEDDAYNPQKGLAAYQKLVGINKIDALINMSSPTIDSIYSKVRKSGIPVAQGGEQGIAPADDGVFQLLPGNIATEIALGKYVKSKGYKNVAVFYSDSGVYVRFVNGFVKGYGGSVKKYGIPVDSTDYSSEVTAALSSKPDAVVFIDTPEQGANLVKLFYQQGARNIPFFFDADVQSGWASYQKILGDTKLLDGSVAVAIRQTVSAAYLKQYKAKFKGDPYVGTDWAYDSFMLLMRSYSSNKKTWVANIKKANFDGAGGKVRFDETGVRLPNFTIAPIKNGELPK
jgi:branched-chain amino acid transport system substrate-binding protein